MNALTRDLLRVKTGLPRCASEELHQLVLRLARESCHKFHKGDIVRDEYGRHTVLSVDKQGRLHLENNKSGLTHDLVEPWTVSYVGTWK